MAGKVRAQLGGAGSLLLPRGVWGSTSGLQAWQQAHSHWLSHLPGPKDPINTVRDKTQTREGEIATLITVSWHRENTEKFYQSKILNDTIKGEK